MLELRVESTRGDMVESVHRVSAAVVDRRGALLAFAGDPGLSTFWRSAAKPFQAIPVVADGVAGAFGFDDRHLALACASHSSEPEHVALATEMLSRVGKVEAELACGPHTPLSAAVAERVLREGLRVSPVWSNCSGKHAAMLGSAVHHQWPVRGYERREHPLQARVLREISRWTGVPEGDIILGVDGCTTVCFALPLRAMALAYARLAVSDDPAAARIRGAMMTHPWLVAGTGRSCTDLMAAAPGRLVAKMGADGVYSAALTQSGVGVALKVEDGDVRTAPPALVAILRQVAERWEPELAGALDTPSVRAHGSQAILNTRGHPVGAVGVAGQLHFAAPSGAGMMVNQARQ